MVRPLFALIAIVLLGAGAPPPGGAKAAAFYDAIAAQRSALTFDGGVFGGPGAAVIAKAVEGTQYVMVGEDHGIAEIPAFATALCQTLGPDGYHTIAVETGPSTARLLSSSLAAGDPAGVVADYDAKHPFSIAFYDFTEEFSFLQQCRKAMGSDRFALWGLDQELMGTSGALLADTASEIPSSQTAVAAKVQQLQAQDARDFAKAMSSGSPGDMSMLDFNESELHALAAQLQAAGVSAPSLDELIASEHIYRENMAGLRQSNLDRTELHRNHFIAADGAAFTSTGSHPKVLIKMGAYHLFEGTSMIGDRELGNFLVEYAALQGSKALNILVLGAQGQQLAFAGMGHPYAPVPLDLLHDRRADFGFIAPFLKGLGSTPVLYDLRALRGPFARSGVQSVDLARVVEGYDLLVVIPAAHAAHQI